MRNHIMFSINIYNIFSNEIKIKWREIWNWSQESSLLFTALQDSGTDYDIVEVQWVPVDAA